MSMAASEARMPALFRLALATGAAPLVTAQLKRGADPNGRDAAGNTPLILAASRGRADICRLLLLEGADPGLANRSGRTAHAMAMAAGHIQVAQVLAADSRRTAARGDPPAEMALPAEGGHSADAWEVEADAERPAQNADILARAVAQQKRFDTHTAVDVDEDWADVVIELPKSERRMASPHRSRSSVRFRRLRMGVASRQSQVALGLHDAMVALDLSRSADDILHAVTLAQVIRSADTSPDLRRCVPRSQLFGMTAADFLSDDEGEAKFLRTPGLKVDDYLELSDLLNAFTVLVHQEAGRGDPAGAPVPASDRPIAALPEDAPGPARRDPDDVLAKTFLSQIVLASGSSSTLRQALARTDLRNMSAAAFLQEEDGESLFRNTASLAPRTYLELSDLVNDFTTRLFEEARGS